MFMYKVLRVSQAYFSSYAGKDLADPRVLTDVGDVPIQEMRDSGIGDELLMKAVSDSVKLVMDEVKNTNYILFFTFEFCPFMFSIFKFACHFINFEKPLLAFSCMWTVLCHHIPLLSGRFILKSQIVLDAWMPSFMFHKNSFVLKLLNFKNLRKILRELTNQYPIAIFFFM